MGDIHDFVPSDPDHNPDEDFPHSLQGCETDETLPTDCLRCRGAGETPTGECQRCHGTGQEPGPDEY